VVKLNLAYNKEAKAEKKEKELKIMEKLKLEKLENTGSIK